MREKRRFLSSRRSISSNRSLVIPTFLLVPLALALLTLTFILIGQVTGISNSGYGPLGTIQLLSNQIKKKLFSVSVFSETQSKSKVPIISYPSNDNNTKSDFVLFNSTDKEHGNLKNSISDESTSNSTLNNANAESTIAANEKKKLKERMKLKKGRNGERARVCYRHFMNNHNPGESNVLEPPFPDSEEKQKEYFNVSSKALDSMNIFSPRRNSSSSSSSSSSFSSSWTWPPDELFDAQDGLECSSKPFSTMEMEDHADRNYFSVLSVPNLILEAKNHLSEAVGLARMMNRSFILPRVGHGHISLFYAGSYCSYFDTSPLANYVDWVTDDFYTEMLTCMELKLNVTYVCVRDTDAMHARTNVRTRTHKTSVSECFSHMRPQHFMSIMAFTGGDHPHENNTVVADVDDLHAFTVSNDVDLVVFLKLSDASAFVNSRDVSDSPLIEASKYVRFSPNLISKANLVRSRLQPKFIAIRVNFQHMRMDAMTCMEALIKAVKKRMSDSGVEEVFLASDLSTYENHTRDWLGWDGVMTEANSKDKEAIVHVVKSINAIVIEDLIPIPVSMDAGSMEIINLLVCSEADSFLSAPGQCGGGSGFDLEVDVSRKDLNKKETIKWGL